MEPTSPDVVTSPDEIEISPVLPETASPEAIEIAPLAPLPELSAEAIEMFPDVPEEDELAPDTRVT
jgi:hypothetical protein